jgi:eukaryotic-like serine/threonine-protein kinase
VQEVQTILPLGSIVGGRYLVEELLGKGGFGAVYRVKDQRVRQNLFALKEVINPNRQERKRFVLEADLLRRLDHPALPRVYHVFEDAKNERAYMLMDYVEGSNLEVLRRQQPNKRFSVPQVLSIMAPIMNAASYLHNQQPPIIHRDIKPANIILPPSGNEAVLIDFGIAKEFDPDSTTTAVRHASPGYAAPEQYGIGTNTRTDVYGLGATIYTLLTGVVPADSFYRITQLGSKGTDPLESIRKFAPNVPQHIADAIYRAMAVDINDRFPTVQDFWQELNALAVEDYHSPGPIVIPGPTAAQSRPATINTPIPPVHDDTTFVMQRGPQNRRRLGVLLLLLLALFAGVATAMLLPFIQEHRSAQTSTTPTVAVAHKPTITVTHRVTPISTPGLTPTQVVTQPSPPPSTPVPAGYPGVNGTYNGTIIDVLGPIRGIMSLAIQQKQANISGNFTVSGGLTGNGPFTGYVTNKGYIQFIVQSRGVNPLFFYGSVQANGNLGGNYCSLNNTGHCDSNVGGYGTWGVVPESPGSGS